MENDVEGLGGHGARLLVCAPALVAAVAAAALRLALAAVAGTALLAVALLAAAAAARLVALVLLLRATQLFKGRLITAAPRSAGRSSELPAPRRAYSHLACLSSRVFCPRPRLATPRLLGLRRRPPLWLRRRRSPALRLLRRRPLPRRLRLLAETEISRDEPR